MMLINMCCHSKSISSHRQMLCASTDVTVHCCIWDVLRSRRRGTPIDSQCKAANVQGFPTWVIDGKIYEGDRTFEELAKASGYKASNWKFNRRVVWDDKYQCTSKIFHRNAFSVCDSQVYRFGDVCTVTLISYHVSVFSNPSIEGISCALDLCCSAKRMSWDKSTLVDAFVALLSWEERQTNHPLTCRGFPLYTTCCRCDVQTTFDIMLQQIVFGPWDQRFVVNVDANILFTPSISNRRLSRTKWRSSCD